MLLVNFITTNRDWLKCDILVITSKPVSILENVKGKSIPLKARGAQMVPGS